MDNFLSTLAARCATKSAELHKAAEGHFNGHFNVPLNLGLRLEADAVGDFGKMLAKLIGMTDAEPADVASSEPPKLAFTLVPGPTGSEQAKEAPVKELDPVGSGPVPGQASLGELAGDPETTAA